MENILPERTGIIVKAGCERSIYDAMKTMVADPDLRQTMSREARKYMENRSFEAAFDETWKMFGALNESKMMTGS